MWQTAITNSDLDNTASWHRWRRMLMESRRIREYSLANILFALIAAACGSSTAGTTSTTSSAAPTTKPPAITTSPTSQPSTTTPAPTSTATTTTSTTTAPGCESVLLQGCNTNDVRRLQQLLRERGFTTTPADGQFGPQTERALQAFEATCPSCTRDAQIVIAGPEWTTLTQLPVIPAAPPPLDGDRSR
jgi:hypothetical protein